MAIIILNLSMCVILLITDLTIFIYIYHDKLLISLMWCTGNIVHRRSKRTEDIT